MNNINWHSLFLKKNPFGIVPDKSPENIFWAGFESIKSKYEKTFLSLLNSDESRIVLNVSRWGGGKTHAAYFYSDPKNIPGIAHVIDKPISIIINTPKEGNIAPNEFFKLILEELGIDKLTQLVSNIRTTLGSEMTLAMLKETAKNDIIAKIIWNLGDADPDTSFEASELLFNSPTASQRKKFRMSRGIEGTSDKFRLIATLFKLLSNYNDKGNFIESRKIFLWMDEIESLILYSSKHYIPFTQALRELVDDVSSNFYLFLNFSLSDYDDLRTLEFIIGKALFDRITDKNFFDEPSTNEGLAYIKQSLEHWRTDDFNRQNEFFPFIKEKIEYILTVGPEMTSLPLTARTINKWCLAFLNKANEMGLLEPPVSELNDDEIYNFVLAK